MPSPISNHKEPVKHADRVTAVLLTSLFISLLPAAAFATSPQCLNVFESSQTRNDLAHSENPLANLASLEIETPQVRLFNGAKNLSPIERQVDHEAKMALRYYELDKHLGLRKLTLRLGKAIELSSTEVETTLLLFYQHGLIGGTDHTRSLLESFGELAAYGLSLKSPSRARLRKSFAPYLSEVPQDRWTPGQKLIQSIFGTTFFATEAMKRERKLNLLAASMALRTWQNVWERLEKLEADGSLHPELAARIRNPKSLALLTLVYRGTLQNLMVRLIEVAPTRFDQALSMLNRERALGFRDSLDSAASSNLLGTRQAGLGVFLE